MTVTALPIWLVDMIGAVGMITLSFLCIHHVRALSRRDRQNVIWTYLTWVSYCMAGFAISRSAGHILKQMLIVSNHPSTWAIIRPYSGAVNTFLLIIVASFTLFFERAWRVYRRIMADQEALRSAHEELLSLNQNLEKRVVERTEALARSEKQIAQADKLASIGQLSSGIAHEINNPLGIILGYTQLLLRQEEPESQKHEDLKTIEKHVKSCKSIVEDLLNFARSSPTRREQININEVIDDVLTFIRHRSKLEPLHIETDYDDAVPLMLMDEKKIKQVLINLLMNAAHATDNKGNIRIATRFIPDSDRVAVSVKDDGYGIDRKNISRIFDPFFTTKPTGEGTGLGLAVSYGIVKNHGGDIEVASRPGHGAEFTIFLPVTPNDKKE